MLKLDGTIGNIDFPGSFFRIVDLSSEQVFIFRECIYADSTPILTAAAVIHCA